MAKTLDAAGVKRLIQEIKGANKNLNAPIPISTENTPESMAQNVKNIADYVEKAKAAGIADVNGMSVTCLIDNDYSGVGYFYMVEGTFASILGIKSIDDVSEHYVFNLESSGNYFENLVLTATSSNVVTSDMLTQGARKPIILTPSTTEVDEETYQKLLSDDVDVVFKTAQVNLYTLASKYDGDTSWYFYFTCFSCEGDTADDIYISAYEVNITKTTPHTCTIGPSCEEVTFHGLIEGVGYLNKSTLTPVLKEIDLTGTDAERKAKLDQFETDWRALTGASDLDGARFVGLYTGRDNHNRTALFVHRFSQDSSMGIYEGISMNSDDGYSGISKNMNEKVSVNDYNGSLTITPLFSHLEAIAIRTGNTPEAKAANVAAIKAYVDNLKALGIDTTKGYTIPIRTSEGIIGEIYPDKNNKYRGFVIRDINSYAIIIEQDGTLVTWFLLDSKSNYATLLTTDNKRIIPAINEVNDLAKGYSTIFTPIELTTETAQNKTAIDARVAAFTAQGISLTNGCCIPVTYKGVYAGNISLINGDWYGLLVKNTNNPADNINIKLSADGTITEGNSAQ